jgi:hypothetical protein
MHQKVKFNKRKILQSLIEIPKGSKRETYSREMKLLNSLIEKYSIEFISILKLDKKFDSIAILLCDSFEVELNKRFRNFNFEIDISKYETYCIHENKFGEDIPQILKPKTIRDFLNG